jgi:hypothetical protein
LRGTLLRLLDEAEEHRAISSVEMKQLICAGFAVLEKAIVEYAYPNKYPRGLGFFITSVIIVHFFATSYESA